MTSRNCLFKTMVALRALSGGASLAELAVRYRLDPQEIAGWRRSFLDSLERWECARRYSR